MHIKADCPNPPKRGAISKCWSSIKCKHLVIVIFSALSESNPNKQQLKCLSKSDRKLIRTKFRAPESTLATEPKKNRLPPNMECCSKTSYSPIRRPK